MRNPAGPSAGEHESHLGAAGYPEKRGIIFSACGLGKAGRDEEQEKNGGRDESCCRTKAVRDHVGLPRVSVDKAPVKRTYIRDDGGLIPGKNPGRISTRGDENL